MERKRRAQRCEKESERESPQHATDVSENHMIRWKVKESSFNICLTDSAAVMSSCCKFLASAQGAVRKGAAFLWAESLDDAANCSTAERADALQHHIVFGRGCQ